MQELLVKCWFVAVLATIAVAQDQVTAEVLPWQRLVVAAAVPGRVTAIPAEEGARVEPGQALVELSAPALELAAARSQAALAGADAELRSAELEQEIAGRELSVAERTLKIAAERLPHAEQTVDAAERRAENVKVLFEAGRVPDGELQQARLELARAKEAWSTAGEQVKAAQDRVEIAKLEVRRRALRIERARARLERARAELALAHHDVEQTVVRAPFAATLHRVFVSPGALVAARDDALLELLDLSRVRVRFAVDASTARALSPGATVTVRRGETLVPGKVTAVDVALDVETQTRGAEVVLDNADGAWLVGELVAVTLRGG